MNWMLALIPVMFTYSGWNAAAYLSEELHDVKRTIGPVLFIGTMIVVGLYALLNALYPLRHSAGENEQRDQCWGRGGAGVVRDGGNFMTPALIVALLGSISAMTIAGPRVSILPWLAMAPSFRLWAASARGSGRRYWQLHCKRCGV